MILLKWFAGPNRYFQGKMGAKRPAGAVGIKRSKARATQLGQTARDAETTRLVAKVDELRWELAYLRARVVILEEETAALKDAKVIAELYGLLNH
ncbi:hypothetical protein DIURU_001858 [Diutina rugosa]|uniref:Uncharacterized protein n=1 Tax=Diutina rugosa TaxID=5481 RepID=A0A642UT98_DIURU|nr:uncharacterized protein DIURU_001858 [Diutina rugosa]KAA8904782.1 hypothetical protein DIURU_001858 [Diutina rugosa]